MKYILASFVALLPTSGFAEDLVFDCTTQSGEGLQLTRHFEKNTGAVNTSTFQGDVLVFPGLESLTFLDMFGNGASWVVSLVATEGSYEYSMSQGNEFAFGTCSLASGEITASIDQGEGSSSSRSRY